MIADIEPIARISQKVGLAIECCAFIGSSPIRVYAEDWTLDRLVALTEEAIAFAVKEGLPVMYVTEDIATVGLMDGWVMGTMDVHVLTTNVETAQA